ncbi:MAG: hypothetical protein ACK5JF_13440, partial [Oscillospiraceae bacterium]
MKKVSERQFAKKAASLITIVFLLISFSVSLYAQAPSAENTEASSTVEADKQEDAAPIDTQDVSQSGDKDESAVQKGTELLPGAAVQSGVSDGGIDDETAQNTEVAGKGLEVQTAALLEEMQTTLIEVVPEYDLAAKGTAKGDSIALKAKLTDSQGNPIVKATIRFQRNSESAYTRSTDTNGEISFSFTGNSSYNGAIQFTVSYAGNTTYAAASWN